VDLHRLSPRSRQPVLAWAERGLPHGRVDDGAAVRLQSGAQVTFGVSIRNPGPWPVTIIGITAGDFPADDPVFKTTRVTVNHADKSTTAVFDPAAATPLRSTRVGAGMELPVFVTITIPDVEVASGSSIWFGDVTVDYWLLGLAHHQRVPLGFRLSLYSPNGYIPR
jgi:hypothetical protein